MKRIKQSVSWWCLEQSGLAPEQLARMLVDIGYMGVDLVGQQHWPLLKEHGLRITAINGHQSITEGLNRREHHARIEKELLELIGLAEQWQIPNLIVFSGNRAGQDDQEGAEVTAEGLRRVAGAAEQAGVTLVLELLNSKVDHPDYQCDHTPWGVKVCQLVDSPRVKLLYDIYHMQIMEGDIMRTIRAYHPAIAHYHTAGNPGRHELDDRQELNYPGIVRAIIETGFDGYLGQEFVPIGDVRAALQQAFDVCNVAV